MTDIIAGVFQYLGGQTLTPSAKYAPRQAAVTALINDRVYPGKIPQHHFEGARVMPCAVTQIPSESRQVKLCETDGLVEGSVQVDSYSPDRDECHAVADAIRRAMVDYSGPMGTVKVSKVLLATQFDVGPEPDPGLFRRSQTYAVWYLED